ncbi:hypothetical protein EUTSA_v10026551mg [Eutrema salsugineum]|uniref:Uncharacterized protein n=1 Tax=Eutrema salsugineum TaxID=72664 RepID=V4MP45_EUTSA|nr:hypothetical protein EUTSA_v10026551mg [Eutrema salsugineum]
MEKGPKSKPEHDEHEDGRLFSCAAARILHQMLRRSLVLLLWSNKTSNGDETGQAPFYQMQQYYRVGKLDDCTQKFSDLFDCLSLKTKSASEAQKILEERDKTDAAKHIWIIRTQEEASIHWNETFGHLDDPNC